MQSDLRNTYLFMSRQVKFFSLVNLTHKKKRK